MERALPAYTEFVKGMAASGSFHKSPAKQLTHPLVVKMHEIAPDPKLAAASISTAAQSRRQRHHVREG